MKRYLAVPLLLLSFSAFSQNNDKEMLNLMDSIQVVNPYENLYAEINELHQNKEDLNNEIHHLTKQNIDLKEFFSRQISYRIIFDQLELGITLDTLELKKYRNPTNYGDNYWTSQDLSLIEISKSDSKAPIIIFYDPDSNANIPFVDFGIAFKNEDPILKKRYPKVYAMVKSGKIVLSIKSFAIPSTMAMQAIKLDFPSSLFANTDNSLQSRQKLADNLLSWISDVAAPMLSQEYTSKNLVSSYLKVEKEKLKKGTVEDKIELRMKFIEYLRKKYH